MFESPRNSPNPQSLEKLFHRSGPWCLKGWGPLLTHVCVLLFRLPMVPLFNNNSGGNRVSKSWLRLLLYRSHGALNCISLFDPGNYHVQYHNCHFTEEETEIERSHTRPEVSQHHRANK